MIASIVEKKSKHRGISLVIGHERMQVSLLKKKTAASYARILLPYSKATKLMALGGKANNSINCTNGCGVVFLPLQ
jgi:hypothetical protein